VQEGFQVAGPGLGYFGHAERPGEWIEDRMWFVAQESQAPASVRSVPCGVASIRALAAVR
jgi:hypothetical protein